MPTKAITEPTDRSTPPRINTTVMPQESSRSKVSEVKIPEKFDADKNVPGRSNVIARVRTAVKISSVTTRPSSTFLRSLRLVLILKPLPLSDIIVVIIAKTPFGFWQSLVAS